MLKHSWRTPPADQSSDLHFRHLLTLFGVIIILICWGSLWLYITHVDKQGEHDAAIQLENMTLAIERNIENDIRQIDLLLKFVLATKKQIGFGTASLHPIRDVFTIKDALFHVSYTDVNGNVGDNTAFAGMTRSVNIFDREHFRVHINARPPGFLFISKPVVGRGTGKPTIQLSRGIYGENGEFQGVMVAGVAPQSMLTGFDGLNLGAASGIAIIGDDDIIRAGTGSFERFIGLGLREGEQEAVEHTKGSAVEIVRTKVDGAAQMISFAKIGGYPLSVVVTMGVPSRFAWLSSHEIMLIFGALLLSGLIVFLVYAAHRGLVIDRLRIQLRDQKAANAMQRNFISMASHEFRTPMAIIDSSAQKLNSRAETIVAKEIADRARIIRNSVKRMSDLMERILSAARLEEGGLTLEPTTFSLPALITECVARAQDLDAARIFDVRIDRLPRLASADQKLLDQVFSNLITNAAKYSPPSTVIEIDGWTQGSNAVIEVTDHGIGIDADDIDRLFTRFFRAKTAEGIAGTGIGLYVVKLIVEKHGGTVSVRSKKGVGTTFTVTLPAKPADAVLLHGGLANWPLVPQERASA